MTRTGVIGRYRINRVSYSHPSFTNPSHHAFPTSSPPFIDSLTPLAAPPIMHSPNPSPPIKDSLSPCGKDSQALGFGELSPCGEDSPALGFGEVSPCGEDSPARFGELSPCGEDSPTLGFGEVRPCGEDSPALGFGELSPCGEDSPGLGFGEVIVHVVKTVQPYSQQLAHIIRNAAIHKHM